MRVYIHIYTLILCLCVCVCVAVPQDFRGIGSSIPEDTKIHRYSSPLYKMEQYSRPSTSVGSTVCS